MTKLSLDPLLPRDMDVRLRARLTDVLRSFAARMNYATHLDITSIASNTTVAHDLVLCSTSSVTVVATLPPASEFPDRIIHIKKVDAGAGQVFIVGQSGETVDGANTYTISGQYSVVRVMSDGSLWHTV